MISFAFLRCLHQAIYICSLGECIFMYLHNMYVYRYLVYEPNTFSFAGHTKFAVTCGNKLYRWIMPHRPIFTNLAYISKFSHWEYLESKQHPGGASVPVLEAAATTAALAALPCEHPVTRYICDMFTCMHTLHAHAHKIMRTYAHVYWGVHLKHILIGM